MPVLQCATASEGAKPINFDWADSVRNREEEQWLCFIEVRQIAGMKKS
jgi:hypothetical protein